jgi:hypothetical protein
MRTDGPARTGSQTHDPRTRWRLIYLLVAGFNLLVFLSLWLFSQAF